MILIDEVAHEDDAGYFRVGGQGPGLGLGQTTHKVPILSKSPNQAPLLAWLKEEEGSLVRELGM